jgi:ABC-type cobalamin transport system permease subunit
VINGALNILEEDALNILEETASKLPPWALVVLAITSIVIGAILCFAGTKFSKFAVFLLGFEVGAYCGLLITNEVYHDEEHKASIRCLRPFDPLILLALATRQKRS